MNHDIERRLTVLQSDITIALDRLHDALLARLRTMHGAQHRPTYQGGSTVSAKGSRHMANVAGLGCILCRHLGYGETPAEVHHLKEECGAGQRQSDFIVAPLCTEHHRGATGLHGMGRKAFERTYRLTELDLLALTIEALTP